MRSLTGNQVVHRLFRLGDKAKKARLQRSLIGGGRLRAYMEVGLHFNCISSEQRDEAFVF